MIIAVNVRNIYMKLLYHINKHLKIEHIKYQIRLNFRKSNSIHAIRFCRPDILRCAVSVFTHPLENDSHENE